jgi:hypothetical protein
MWVLKPPGPGGSSFSTSWPRNALFVVCNEFALWILLGPALIALVGLGAVGYQSAKEQVESTLSSMAFRLAGRGTVGGVTLSQAARGPSWQAV